MKATSGRLRVAVGGAVLVLFSAAIFYACAPSYKDISTANGRLAILQQAGDDITAGDCAAALSTLQPLIESSYADYDAFITESSAYACQGGLFFPAILGNLRNMNGQDIWGVLIRSDPSGTLADGRRAAIDKAELYLRLTVPDGVFDASARTSDANMYMVFQQLVTIALTIAPLGNAHLTTGKKGSSITFAAGAVPMLDECHMAVAIATINDSLKHVNPGSVISSISAAMTAACATLPAGACPTTRNINDCLASDPDTTAGSAANQGLLLFAAIDQQWK